MDREVFETIKRELTDAASRAAMRAFTESNACRVLMQALRDHGWDVTAVLELKFRGPSDSPAALGFELRENEVPTIAALERLHQLEDPREENYGDHSAA